MLQPGYSKTSGWAYIRCMRQLHHPLHTSSNQEVDFTSGSTNTGSQSLAWRDLMSWSWLPHCHQSRWDHHLGVSFPCLFWSLVWITISVSEFLLINQYCAVDSSTVSIYFIRDPLREFIIRSSSLLFEGGIRNPDLKIIPDQWLLHRPWTAWSKPHPWERNTPRKWNQSQGNRQCVPKPRAR